MFRALILAAVLSGCANAPEGLRRTPKGPGPTVVVDWDALPLPELPFPNDLATRADPNSPTGLRVNISQEAPTELERKARRKIDQLTGFGVYSALSVRFDAPLDLDNILDRHDWDYDPSDDAIYVIDVTPGSPSYLQVVDLDIGHGRFPQDLADPGAYFPLDVHADVPSLLFDTHDEDLDGDGELDFEEDVDHDGWLDVPNVHPPGGDPREDLLSWYEKVTNTLIFRPVVPLREETTYAVVLTERLVGEDGNPVRSPWKYVNHTRQTQALEPVLKTLGDLGVKRDDVGYAWTFTTGRITGDLFDIYAGLDGKGPYPNLRQRFKPGVRSAERVHEIPAFDSEYELPVTTLTSVLTAVGYVSEEEGETIKAGYDFAHAMVGGTFHTPFFLADRDDHGYDSVDEWFEMDPVAGTYNAEGIDVPFTCVIPKETAEHQQPFPVAVHGHGYGSNRLETFLFAWAYVPYGVATCSFDFPGHGTALAPDERDELEEIIGPLGLMPFIEHAENSRYTDTDNDGVPDSGSHQWTADVFHTRDQVRQAVVDWMWFFEALKECGKGKMDMDGRKVVTCDWNEDGIPDIGGPDVDYMLDGGSLGGINAGVAAAILDDVDAFVPVVAGGGLMDISTRAPTGGAVEAMHGKLMSPLILGYPDGAGGLDIYQMANSYMDMAQLHLAHVKEFPVGGRFMVENLDNGEVREGALRADGSFRIGIPADALDYFEKRKATHMPLDGPPPNHGTYSVRNNRGLGDRLRVTLFDKQGNIWRSIVTFDQEGVFQGVTYRAGSPLVALASGLGRVRGAPETRRLVSVVSMAIEPGDPIAYARYWVQEPRGKPRNVLVMPTPGDMVVSINSEYALARAAGFIDWREKDPRYGMSEDQWLVEVEAIRGLEEFGPWTGVGGVPVLFDVGDFDNGINEFGEPSDAPWRPTFPTASGVSAVRVPYANPNGSHGFGLPDPDLQFDINTFAVNQLATYLTSRGQHLSDAKCMANTTCSWMPHRSKR